MEQKVIGKTGCHLCRVDAINRVLILVLLSRFVDIIRIGPLSEPCVTPKLINKPTLIQRLVSAVLLLTTTPCCTELSAQQTRHIETMLD